MLPRANLDDFGNPPPCVDETQGQPSQKKRPSSQNGRAPSSSSHRLCSTSSKFLALSFRHYAAYLYFQPPEIHDGHGVHVQPNARNSKRRRKSTSPSPISSPRYRSRFVPLTYSLSRLSLDGGRANVSQALYNALYFIFLGLVCILCSSKQACNGNSLPPLSL